MRGEIQNASTAAAILIIVAFSAFSCRVFNRNVVEEISTVESIGNKYLRVETSRRTFNLRIIDKSTGAALLETAGPAQFTTVTDLKAMEFLAWYFFFGSETDPWIETPYVASVHMSDRIEYYLTAKKGGAPVAKINISFPDEKSVKVSYEVLNRPEVNRVKFRFRKGRNDTYFGMGERYNRAEHSGERVRVWCEEGGQSIFWLSKIIPNLGWNPFPKGQDTTYFPVPYFLNLRGYGFLLDDTHYSEFDFGESDPSILEIENWNDRFDFILFYGPKPLDVIEEATSYTGRATVPQPWAFAPWNNAASGSEGVRALMDTVRREGIPTSAIWAEDWWWDDNAKPIGRSSEWALSPERYPDYRELIAEMHDRGFRMLGYFQPFIFEDSRLFREAAAKNYLTMNPDGSPAVFDVTFSKKAQPDLTNPDAVKWWQDTLYQRSVDWGVDGWMTDYSEYTPPYSVSHDGRDGWALHNEYPVLWAKITREFFDRARPDGDYVFFVRAGYTGSQKYAPVMWTGDSNTSWDKLDGLPSIIPAVNSVGISGFPVTSTDIAGYHCVMASPTDKELFIRWTELGAMLPVMRNHLGWKACDNWRFDSDRQTLDVYKKYAVLHTSLFPYFYTLAYEAAATGRPIIRHMALHYPDDKKAAAQEYQFMIGDRIIVAPIVKKGAQRRRVYLPEGEWIDFWGRGGYRGPATVEANAPLESIPIYVKSGSILPLFDSQIDTLVHENSPDIKGFDDANRSMKIIMFGYGKAEYTLWDGTHIACNRNHPDEGSCDVDGAPLDRKYTSEFR